MSDPGYACGNCSAQPIEATPLRGEDGSVVFVRLRCQHCDWTVLLGEEQAEAFKTPRSPRIAALTAEVARLREENASLRGQIREIWLATQDVRTANAIRKTEEMA
jgi:hypothetical protein